MYPDKDGGRLLAEPAFVRLYLRDVAQPPEAPAANLNPAAMCATELG